MSFFPSWSWLLKHCKSALCICGWFLTGPSLWYSWLSHWFSVEWMNIYGPNSVRLLNKWVSHTIVDELKKLQCADAVSWGSTPIWLASQQWQHCAKGTTQTAELTFSLKSKTLKGTTTSKQSKPWF